MDIIETVWLYAEAGEPNLNAYATHTVDNLPRGVTIVARIALSGYGENVLLDYSLTGDSLTVGAAGALISSWEVYNPDGTTQTFNSTDQANNSRWIDNCASITFQLTVNWAVAYAQATVFSL
jgi:hypothetical protein